MLGFDLDTYLNWAQGLHALSAQAQVVATWRPQCFPWASGGHGKQVPKKAKGSVKSDGRGGGQEWVFTLPQHHAPPS